MSIQTTTDLIAEIRDGADEYNVATKDDDAIIRMMNRGLRYITSQLVRSYQDPLLAQGVMDTSKYVQSVQTPGSTDPAGLPLPRDAFENRVLQIWINTPTTPTPVEARTYRQVSSFEYRQPVAVPQFWYMRGRNVITVPPVQSTYNLLVDYVRKPDDFVRPIGKINAFDTVGGTWVLLDNVDLTQVSVTALGPGIGSFVNIVDGMTGLIKISLQVSQIQGNKISFRASPSFPVMQTKNIQGNTLGLTNDFALSPDDYLCPVAGTCIPQLNSILTGFVVEHSIAALARSLAAATATIAAAIVEEAKKAAEFQKSGRPTTRRIKSRSKVWARIPYARFPYSKSP